MNSTTLMGLGEMRRRQDAAKVRGQRYQVDPAVREFRAAVEERRQALADGREAEAKAERDASPDALRAVLSRGTVDELAEITRMIGRLDGRRLQAIANEVFRERSRTGYQPDDEAPEAIEIETADEASQEDAEAPQAEKASSSSRKR